MAKRTRVIKLTLEELAKEFAAVGFAVTKRWIDRLVIEKGLPRLAKGQYDLVACLKWYIVYIRQQAERDDEKTGNSPNAEKLLAAKANREELKYLRERGDLERRDTLKTDFIAPIAAMRAKLLAMPKRLAPLLKNAKDEHDVERIAETHIYQALTEIAELVPKFAERTTFPSLGDPSVDKAASKADGKPVVRRARTAKRRRQLRARKVQSQPGAVPG